MSLVFFFLRYEAFFKGIEGESCIILYNNSQKKTTIFFSPNKPLEEREPQCQKIDLFSLSLSLEPGFSCFLFISLELNISLLKKIKGFVLENTLHNMIIQCKQF